MSLADRVAKVERDHPDSPHLKAIGQHIARAEARLLSLIRERGSWQSDLPDLPDSQKQTRTPNS